MSLFRSTINRVISKIKIENKDYAVKFVLDSVPTEGSDRGLSSGGAYSDKSNTPQQGSTKNITAHGAFLDKATGVVQGSSKNMTSAEMYKYIRWLLDLTGHTDIQIPQSLT